MTTAETVQLETIQSAATETTTAQAAYATADDALAWKSPVPLVRDHVHSDTQQTFKITGICKAKDRKAIYAEITHVRESSHGLTHVIGYQPTDADITDACWCMACVTEPKMTSLQWLQFGAEASLGELTAQCLIASRIIEDRPDEDTSAKVPDGETAAEAELNGDPS